ncbi:MAG TPA: ABC transporter ATP-binding protein [Desulfobacterales bacterium]|nr:ABC transporter ATP-binding protein [Desulfobacterales bacterium]
MVQQASQELLELRHLEIIRGGRRVLCDIDLKVKQQEIVGIVGPNGAGKTTLMSAIAGQIKPAAGSILFRGQNISSWPPHRRCWAGIARTFQIPKPFPEMTAWENVAIGAWFGKTGRRRSITRSRALKFLEMVGLPHKADTLGKELTLSEQRRLEVARALATQPQILLLDEVAAGLSPKMVSQVAKLVTRLRQKGVTLIIIDHFLNLTLEVSDRLVVLDRGEKIMEGPPPVVIRHPEVVGAYLGTRRLLKSQEAES